MLSDGQLQRINTFRAEHKEPVELCDIAIVLLGVRMGLRAYDILALKFQDIDWKDRQISIVMKKTKTQITLLMPVEVGNAVYSYITSGRPKTSTEHIFIRSKAPYGKLTGKVCTKALYRILPERKDIKGSGFHVTRRTFATNLLRNHAGIDDVMDALGHRDPTSVMKYLLLDDERSRIRYSFDSSIAAACVFQKQENYTGWIWILDREPSAYCIPKAIRTGWSIYQKTSRNCYRHMKKSCMINIIACRTGFSLQEKLRDA